MESGITNPILGHLRAAGLLLLDKPAAKHLLAQKSMGLAQKQTRLDRGIS
ncbi:MAG: hypothetical protein K0A92_03575 [Methyloprofundus sp.]|nr:hypothetical protein [Methyloprofundus sp.]